jgi:hypothetical protein
MPPSPVVASLYREHRELLSYLQENGQLSFSNTTEGTLPKILLLAAASHLEKELQDLIISYFTDVTGDCKPAVSFVNRKAISRQYHTFFDWDKGNGNAFFALFGEDFKTAVNQKIRDDPALAQSVRDFVQLGSMRNQLVHQNYAAFTLEKTSEEIWNFYESACSFIEKLPILLKDQV